MFEGNILTIFTGMIVLPALVMWRRNGSGHPPEFSKSALNKAISISGKSLSVMMPVTFLSFPVIQMLGFNFLSWQGAIIITMWHLAAVPLLCRIFQNEAQTKDQLLTNRDLGWLLSLFTVAVGITFLLNSIHPVAARLFIALIFIGQAEEFLFRGYIQTRLNQVFGKPFSLLGLSFGWGIILASLLFGLMHVLSPGNPWHWAWGFWTFFGGLCFGVIREKGGSFVASGLVHGIIMIFPVIFS